MTITLKWLAHCLACFLIFFTLTFGVYKGHTQPLKEVRIGAILHLTGEFAIQGNAFREGIELAIDRLNIAGREKGIEFKAVFEDTQYRPIEALSAAKRLALNEHVLATLVSTVIEAKAAGTVFEHKKFPAIVLWDSSPELDNIGRYVFGIGPWAPSSGAEAAKYAVERLKAKRAVIINTNTEWSVYVSDWFEKEMTRLGGSVVAHYSLDPAESDFRTVLLKSKNLNADVLYAPIDSNILPFFRQLRELRYEAPIITSDILDAELFEEGGPLLEGVFQTMSGDPEQPETLSMIAEYQKKFAHEPDYTMLTAWGFDGAMIVGNLALSGHLERETLVDELYKIKNFPGASGIISINESGSSPREVSVFVVKNQKLVSAS